MRLLYRMEGGFTMSRSIPFLLFLFVFGLAINAYEEGNYPIKLPEPNNMLTEEE